MFTFKRRGQLARSIHCNALEEQHYIGKERAIPHRATTLEVSRIVANSARSASFILLQAAPPTVSPLSMRDVILCMPGVLSLHELHIWQLSESKLVALRVTIPWAKTG
jgi:hypothetical protein